MCSEEMCEMNAAKNDTSLEDGSWIQTGKKSMRSQIMDCIVYDDERSDDFMS